MLPLIVLARFDAILANHTDQMKTVDENKNLPAVILDKKLTEIIE